MKFTPHYWTPTQQVCRILRNDLRLLQFDILLAFLFILASYAVSRPILNDPHNYLVAPMIITSLCVLYLNARLIAEETAADTIQFFTNLPRHKMLTYWTRTIFILSITTIYYLINFAGLNFKTHFNPGHTYAIRSIHWTLPLYMIMINSWMYLVQSRLSRSIIMVVCFLIFSPIFVASQMESREPGINLLPLTVILFPFIMLLLARQWKRLQPGEES